MTPDQRRPGADPMWLVFAASLVLSAVLLWWFARPAIVAAVFAIADALLAVHGWFSPQLEPLRAQIGATHPADPSVTVSRLWRLLSLAGGPWAWPAAALLGACAVAAYRKVGTRRFTRDLSLNDLLREHAKIFPNTAAFAARTRLGLAEPRSHLPPRPLDPALHVAEWADRFAKDRNGRYCDDMAQAALAAQLGPLWSGVRQAPPVCRVLFATFALQAVREPAEALAMLGKASSSLSTAAAKEAASGPEAPLPLDAAVVAEADAILLDPDLRLLCEAVAKRHAYTVPALMSVLCHARLRGGVLNPGLFAWVRLVDRSLFLALDSLGAPTPATPWQRGPMPAPLIEGVGARDHWARELEAGPIVMPQVSGALAAVRAAAEYAGTPDRR